MPIDLPTDIDATYPDNPGDTSVEIHQQYHDEIHGRLNLGAGLTDKPVKWNDTTKRFEDATADLSATYVPATVITPSGDTTGVTDTAAIQAALTAGGVVYLKDTAGAGIFYYTGLNVEDGSVLVMNPPGIQYAGRTSQPVRLQHVAAAANPSFTVSTGGAVRNVVLGGTLTASENGALLASGCDVDGLFVFEFGGWGITDRGPGLRHRIWSYGNTGRGVVPETSDAVWNGFYIAANGSDGIYIGAGIDACQYSGGKIEWNQGNGVSAYQAGTVVFEGVTIDRNGLYAVRCDQSTVTVNGPVRRSYSTATGGAHFYVTTGGRVFHNGSLSHGKNDDNTGNDTPDYVAAGGGSTSRLGLRGNLDIGSASGTAAITAVLDPGIGPLILDPGATPPWRQEIDPSASPAIASTGSWSFSPNSSSARNGYFGNSGVVNDSLEYEVIVGPGTYAVDLFGVATTDSPIITVSMDDGAGTFTTLGTIDLYDAAGPTFNVVRSLTGIVITGAAGPRRLRLKAASKNASSSNYYAHFVAVTLRRTA